MPICKRLNDILLKLARVVHTSLARKPGDRFPDVKALGDEFRPTPPS